MTDNSDNGFLYFMVGVLVIGLIGLGYFYYNGTPARSGTSNTTIIENTTTERIPTPVPSDTTTTPAPAPASKY